jgi:hypothetical protein
MTIQFHGAVSAAKMAFLKIQLVPGRIAATNFTCVALDRLATRDYPL